MSEDGPERRDRLFTLRARTTELVAWKLTAQSCGDGTVSALFRRLAAEEAARRAGVRER